MVSSSRLARPILGASRSLSYTGRVTAAYAPPAPSEYARPEMVDIDYKYPGSPSYPGIGPNILPEKWERDEKVVHYVIPKTFVDWLEPKLGKTGIYTFLGLGVLAVSSKEIFVWNLHMLTAFYLIPAAGLMNMLAGDMIRNYVAEESVKKFDRLYAIKKHDVNAYTDIVQKYKDAQFQSQGQALYNDQKLTNLALMLETEFYNRQNSLTQAVTQKLNYQVAITHALADQERKHMVDWIEREALAEVATIDQNEQIEVCVAQLKAASAQ